MRFRSTPRSALAAADASSASVGEVSEDRRLWRAVAAVSITNGAHFYSVSSIFPYAGFLAVDRGWADDVDSAGYCVGLLATVTVLARVPTSVVWGRAADRFGWRVCIDISVISIITGSLLFGISEQLWQAMGSRCLFLGALNGWPVLTGLVVAEVGGSSGTADVMSKMMGIGSLFALIGPAVGGWTYDAAQWAPPALPPNVVGATLCVMALVLNRICLRKRAKRRSTAVELSSVRESVHDGGEGGDAVAKKEAVSSGSTPEVTSRSDAPSRATGGDMPSSTWDALRAAPLPLVIFHRTAVGFYLYLIWDVFPLFAIASYESGGLSLSHQQLGTNLAISAMMQGAYMLSLSGRVIKRLGIKYSILGTALVQGSSLLLLPFTRVLPESLLLPSVAVLYTLIGICNATSVVVSYSATNECAQRHPQRKGAINGVASCVESLGKGVGPVLGASLFALTLERSDARVFFAALGIALVATYGFVGVCMPSSIASAQTLTGATASSPAQGGQANPPSGEQQGQSV